MAGTELAALEWDWRFWARPKQLAPPGDWLTWILRAGRGFGKTRSGAGWAHERAMAQPGRWEAWVAKTPADARDYMVEGPGGILRNVPPWERPDYEPSKRRLTWPNESWATIYSSEDPDQLRGFSGDTAWLDELLKYKNPREVWDLLQFGMREPSDDGTDHPRICITTTPRPHPLLMEIEALSTTATVTGSSYENRANLDPQWFSRILAAYEGTRLGRQEIHAEILEDVEGRVYYGFVNRPFPEGNIDASITDNGGEILIGQDFNVLPMASVIAVRAGDECLILDALEVPTSNTEEVSGEYGRRFPGRRVAVCPDPSGTQRRTSAPVGQTDFTILKRAGFEVRAPKAAPAVVDRVNNTNQLLSKRKIRIHPRAVPLIKALSNLAYKDGTSIRDKGSGWDHVCFAGNTPVLTARGEVPIQEIRQGDIVLTRFGFFPVAVAGMTHPGAEVFEVELDNGRRITATPDHPFYVVGEGFVPLRELTASAMLCAWQNLNPWPSAASCFGGTPVRRTPRSAPITPQPARTGWLAWDASTKRSGKQLTGTSRRGTTFTIGTVIRSTTTLPTLNVCQEPNTYPATVLSLIGSMEEGPRDSWTPCDTSPLNGTARTRGGLGTGSTPARSGDRGNERRSGVPGVASLPRNSTPPEAVGASVLGIALPQSAARQAWTTRTGPVNGAARPIGPTDTARLGHVHGVAVRICAIRPAADVPVYNLTVAGPHEYFAGGVLVSNCDALDYLLWQEFNVLVDARPAKPFRWSV